MDAPRMQVGRIVTTMEDGSQYTDLSPIPCERQAKLILMEDDEPYGLVIDDRYYRIRLSPRLPAPPPGSFHVQLCRRLQPGE